MKADNIVRSARGFAEWAWRRSADAAVRINAGPAGRSARAAWGWFARTRVGRHFDAWLAGRRDYFANRFKGSMTARERRLMERVMEGLPEPECIMRTGGRADVGQWWNQWLGGGRLWLAVVGENVTLVAQGKRPHVERIPRSALGASQYNQVTGELVLAKAANDTVRKLKMQPVEGWQVIKLIGSEGV
jgi:hypothetical protein